MTGERYMADDREATRVTRRTVLGAGITGALACFVSSQGSGSNCAAPTGGRSRIRYRP